ncbi:MAG: Cytochrome c peroxidase family protein [Betaproteobacteria bacterium]|nr:Cytochrome c peroxidase family protein [Betaproteobacteria bacterium]
MRKRSVFMTLSGTVAIVLGTFMLSQTVMTAQKDRDDGHRNEQGGRDDNDRSKPPPGPLTYNPYPPGIVPGDIIPELERVRREVRLIFNQTLAVANALPPPILTGQPPTLQGTGYQAVQTLGKLLNYDENMSPNRNVACASCHMPYAAFSGPIPSVNLTMIAYPGSVRYRAGKRTAPRYTYSPRFPVLDYNTTQGLFFGGNFWDGRSTGYLLQSPDAEQAQHPPVDTQEMALPDTACVAFRISQAVYRPLFERVWGMGSLDIRWPHDTEKICSTPGGAAVLGQSTGGNTMPIRLDREDRTKANRVYDNWGQSISFFESSPSVSPFTSKFDAFLKGTATLTPVETAGYNLFRGKAGCNTCHLDGRGSTQTPGTGSGTTPSTTTGTDTSAKADVAPLFTCFGFANLGLPLNPRNAFFYQTKPDPYGFTPNPLGFGYRDLGLGTFLRSGFGSAPNPNAQWIKFAPTTDGQMQVATARNVAMTPPQCPTTEAPGPYFQKEFFHNGYIKSLKQLVHFYNTRDVFRFPVTSGNCPAGKTEKVDCWPMAEVPNNIDMTTGNLGLTDLEENQIVAFLQTLTDGFTIPFPDRNTYTGVCMTGGTAATQGNAFLIRTPPLPPCSPQVCGVQPLPGPRPIP